MFPPLDGAPEHPFLFRTSSSLSSALLSRANSSRTLHRPDSEKTSVDGLQLMSASMVQPSQPMLATVELMENGRATSRPLSYPGSESDFFWNFVRSFHAQFAFTHPFQPPINATCLSFFLSIALFLFLNLNFIFAFSTHKANSVSCRLAFLSVELRSSGDNHVYLYIYINSK